LPRNGKVHSPTGTGPRTGCWKPLSQRSEWLC